MYIIQYIIYTAGLGNTPCTSAATIVELALERAPLLEKAIAIAGQL
jgi:hypothetical protein